MMPRLCSASMLLGAVVLAVPAAARERIIYCCTDDYGRQVCSDLLPAQCYGRAYREIGPTGITVRHVAAPLTAEQRAQKEAAAKKAKEDEVRRREQERRDRALLATYATEQEIDYARDRTVTDIEKAIEGLQEKQAELAKRKQQLDSEAEFYKKKPMPPQLQAQMHDNDTEMKAQQAAIEARQKEIGIAKARYEEEKLRYRELTRKPAAGEAAVASPQGGPVRPR